MTFSASAAISGTDSTLHLDSVAAILYMRDGRYLLQHREDRDDIQFPNWWGLFGGARELGEDADAALQREMSEELEFQVREHELFVGCTFDLYFKRRHTRKIFYSIEMTEAESRGLLLREGQAMAWFCFADILGHAEQIIPYDLGMITLHHSLRAAR